MKQLVRLSICLLFSYNAYANVNRFGYDERPAAYQTRAYCAYNQNFNVSNYDIENDTNGDEVNVPNFAAQFTKSFAHDPVTGIATDVGQQSYLTLLKAVTTGDQNIYNAIVRSSPSAAQLKNPQASAAWSLIGRDSSLSQIPLPPTLDSAWGACDLAEVLLMSICRGVDFNEYGTGTGTDYNPFNGGSITQDACTVLNGFGINYKGPREGGVVTPAVLFRGNAAGCLVGPYASQFMWQDLHFLNLAAAPIKQLIPIKSNTQYGVTWEHFVSIQDGNTPVPYNPSDWIGHRYIINGRDIGTAVHSDLPVDFPNQAFNILLNNGFPFSPNLPYYNGSMPNEYPFSTMGPPDVTNVIGGVSVQALKNAWAQKWRANRRLRPEAFAGLAQRVMVTGHNPYGLNASLFATYGGINLMNWLLQYNSSLNANPAYATYLLSQLYPEGSPTHPTYPSGHATFVGAGVTIIKAFMNDTALIKDFLTPVKPNPNNPTQLIPLVGEGEDIMTVGGELDKLASNIALGRNFAGVHYRSDGDEGVLLGERIAIQFLMDWAATYGEQDFTGFALTKRDGTRILITETGVTVIA